MSAVGRDQKEVFALCVDVSKVIMIVQERSGMERLSE